MEEINLYRRRLIPDECIHLKNDLILRREPELLVTGWETLHPRKDLHHGLSVYYLKDGWKISRFYDAGHVLLYYYCDIISSEYIPDTRSLIVTDLLADVIIQPDGLVRVVDVGEICDALESGLLSQELLRRALRSLDSLLDKIYHGRLLDLAAPLNEFDPDYYGQTDDLDLADILTVMQEE